MGKLTGFRKSLLGTVMTLGLLSFSGAEAQMATYYDNNVLVDLSALDGGSAVRSTPAVANPYSQPKMPPVKMPRSTFYGIPEGIAPVIVQGQANDLNVPQGQPESRLLVQNPTTASMPATPKLNLPSQSVKLVKPAQQEKPVVRDVEVAKSEPMPMVKVEPKPVVVAPPAPVAKAPEVKEAPALPTQVVAQAPKPVAAPTIPVAVEKVDPVMPKAMEPKVAEAPKNEPKEPSAPATVMAEAPPPPPPSIVEPKEVESAIKAEVPSTTKTASLPTTSESSVRIAFQSGQSKLPVAAENDLQKLANDLNQYPDDRVQLLAYAGGEDLSASKARRLSLSRALAVRSYLIAQGIRSTRIDVRALGNKTTEEPFDRVDVQIAPR